MRWLRRWRDDEPAPLPDPGIDEAHQALEDALALWPEVQAVTEQIRGIRRRNHLAELADKALRSSR